MSIGQFWNPLKDCALGSLFVMNETLEKSFESSKFDQNRMQKRIGLNMAAFGADSILWATCELYKKNKDKFDDERMVSFITLVTVLLLQYFINKFRECLSSRARLI